MLYHYISDTFKIVSQEDGSCKLFCKAASRWSSGWTYIGKYKSEEQAKSSARSYAS